MGNPTSLVAVNRQVALERSIGQQYVWRLVRSGKATQVYVLSCRLHAVKVRLIVSLVAANEKSCSALLPRVPLFCSSMLDQNNRHPSLNEFLQNAN